MLGGRCPRRLVCGRADLSRLMAIAEPDAPVAEDLEYGFIAEDPLFAWDVETGPGLQFESATAYITKYL